MSDLKPLPSLNMASATIGAIQIQERTDLELASVAARRGHKADCVTQLEILLGRAPDIGQVVTHDDQFGFWVGRHQWMLCCSSQSFSDLASDVKAEFRDTASVTEQSGGWVALDVSGSTVCDMMERLCNVPLRKLGSHQVQRTMIHQMNCFALTLAPEALLILGPRSSAASLYHALTVAARSIA